MTKPTHATRREGPPLSLARWGGAAACLAGVSYGAAGYLDNPEAGGFVIGVVVPVLALSTPALFLGGLVGLYAWLGGGGNRLGSLGSTGLLVGLLGTVLGVIDGVGQWRVEWWPTLPYWVNWMPLLFAGLTVVGAATLVRDAPRRLLGALVLASGTLGWASVLTDPAFSGVLVPERPVHVAFAALFCMSAIAWGWALSREPHHDLKRASGRS